MKTLLAWAGQLLYALLYVPHSLYLRNKPRARVLVLCGREVLLTKDIIGNGQWNIPGGGITKGELPSEAALRELYEETGVKLEPHEVQFLVEDRYHSHGKSFYTVYVARLSEKPPLSISRHEILEAAWLPITEILTNPLAGDDVRVALEALN